MKAQISLGVLLLLELLVTGYTYSSGSRFPLYLLLTAFLPVTALLFFTTSCQLDEQGRLRRDTLIFKFIAFCRPEAQKEDRLQLCPTFWMMVAIMFAFGFLVFISVGAISVLANQFRTLAYMFFSLMFFVAYVMFAIGLFEKVERKTKDSVLNLPILSALALFFFVFFFGSLIFACQGSEFSFIRGVNNGLPAALIFGGGWLVFWLVVFTGWLGTSKTISAYRQSAIPRYITSAYKGICPVLEISPEGKQKSIKQIF